MVTDRRDTGKFHNVQNRNNFQNMNYSNKTNSQERNLSQVFAELQQARMEYEIENNSKQNKKHKAKTKAYDVYYTGSIKNKKNKVINQDKLSFKQWIQYRINKLRYDKQQIKRLAFVTTGAFAVCIALISTNSIFAGYQKEEEIKKKIATNVFETNKESLNLEKIIIENVGITKSKKIIEDEERPVDFEIKKEDDPTLPKGEEKTAQEGVIGKKLVDCIKSYEDDKFIEETIIDEEVTEEPQPQIIKVGTSEFLAKYKVHIGDKLYVTETINLKEKAEENAENICIILDSLDVELEELQLEEKWCKVKYGNYEGYIPADKLTSESVTPGIGEKNRKQKLYSTLDANMDLTKPSGLTLDDYKKVLSENPMDMNKIIENNAENFYNAEQKYKINGIFLASIAIHESAWGSSQIAKDKHNLFGFGAYDRSPYDSANTFDDYSAGIDAVAKYLAVNYLNKTGTQISEELKATGTYYNEPTIAGVNTRYCTDKEWSTKIFKYMDYLYTRL